MTALLLAGLPAAAPAAAPPAAGDEVYDAEATTVEYPHAVHFYELESQGHRPGSGCAGEDIETRMVS